MKHIKKNKFLYMLICAIIIITNILTCGVNVTYAKEIYKITSTNKKIENYLAIGDSIASGYALEDINTRYADIIKANYCIENSKYNNLSKVGMTTDELLEYVQNYDVDRNINVPQIIMNADLITISIGSNDLLDIVLDQIIELLGITPEEIEQQNGSKGEAVINKIDSLNTYQKAVTLGNFVADMYELLDTTNTKQQFTEAIRQYEKTWEKTIDYIRSVNPDAVIVVTEFYNPFPIIKGVLDQSIQEMNTILKDISENETNYYIASIYNSFNLGIYTNVNILKGSFDLHPNKAGHELIANNIIKKVPENISIGVVNFSVQNKKESFTLSVLLENFSNVTCFNGEELLDKNAVVGTGDSFIANGKKYVVVIYGDINGDGQVNVLDALIVLKYSVKKLQLSDIEKIAADVHKPTEEHEYVNVNDALFILKFVTRTITEITGY